MSDALVLFVVVTTSKGKIFSWKCFYYACAWEYESPRSMYSVDKMETQPCFYLDNKELQQQKQKDRALKNGLPCQMRMSHFR